MNVPYYTLGIPFYIILIEHLKNSINNIHMGLKDLGLFIIKTSYSHEYEI